MKPGLFVLGDLRNLSLEGALGARLARGGVIALAIRMTSVALSYLMFVVLARHMSDDSFGQFGFAFSFATFVAIVAVVGQPILVLRFIPVYQQGGQLKLLNGLVRDSRIVVLLGGIVCGALMLVGIRVWAEFVATDVTYLLWSALLMAAMAVSRHQAYILRAFGDIARALAPRDILWRITVIACILVVARNGSTISASFAVNICTLTLVAIVALQMLAHPATRPGALLQRGSQTNRSQWARESVGIWAVTVAQAAGPNFSVVLLGLMLSPEQTGPFFAALKTATLLTLPLAAGAIVGAPLISRYYHAGQIRDVQKILRYLVIGITAPVLVGLVLIMIFGDRILAFFGQGFVSASPVLKIIAIGTLVNALSGPTGFIMNMTGHHREYLVIMIVTQLVSLMILPIASLYYGMVGAAAAVALGMISWNFWVWQWSRKNLLVDPTFYGVLEWLLGRELHPVATDEKT